LFPITAGVFPRAFSVEAAGGPAAWELDALRDAQPDELAAPALLPVERRAAPDELPGALQALLPAWLLAALPAEPPDVLPDALQAELRAAAQALLPALLQEPVGLRAELPDALQHPDAQEPDRKPCAHTPEPEPVPCVRR
jgi:hypothetical protein